MSIYEEKYYLKNRLENYYDKNKIIILIIFIIFIFIALLVRVCFITLNPPGIFPDEASTGYDAWSLITTGYDQHGIKWPFFFISFADDLSGTYRYFVFVSELFLGPNLLAVRLPIVIVGLLTCFFVFLITKMERGKIIATLTTCYLLFSPWHLPYCRTGQRIMLLPLGLTLWYFFRVKWENTRKNLFFYLSWFFLCSSLYTYVPARIIIPLLSLFVICYDIKKQIVSRRVIGMAMTIILLTCLPMLVHAFSNPILFKLRFSQVSVFRTAPDFLSALKIIAKNYCKHFSPSFLFFNGDANLRHSQLGFGELHISQIIFLCLALINYLIRRVKPQSCAIYFLLLISPLPAALSMDGNPHALRSVGMLIPLILLTSEGIHLALHVIPQKKMYIGIILIFLILGLECLNVGYDLLFNYPEYSAQAWQYGTREAILIGHALQHDFDEIWISNKALGADRIVAFVLRIPPLQFISSGLTRTKFRWKWNIPLSEVTKFKTNNRVLFICREKELPGLIDVHPPLIRPDGSIAFRFKTSSFGAPQ